MSLVEDVLHLGMQVGRYSRLRVLRFGVNFIWPTH